MPPLSAAAFEQLLLVEKIKVRPKALWRLHRELRYYSPLLKKTIVVPKDFVTDFASVPRLILAYTFFGGKADEAAVIHDWLYSTQEVSRAIADAVFQEAIESLGYSRFTSTMMYSGVRAGGWIPWAAKNVPQFEHVAAKAPGKFDVYTPSAEMVAP